MHTVLIPLAIMCLSFGLPVAIVGIVFYFNHRRNKLVHATIRAMVEKGTPIPSELLTTQTSTPMDRHRKDLRIGIILLGVGMGLLLATGKLGIIFIFIGLAFLIVARIERTSQVKTDK
jgi:hypothetical protein